LSEPSEIETEDPMLKAMNNNVKLQVSKLLDEQVKEKMKSELVRLQAEEAVRVQAYTTKW